MCAKRIIMVTGGQRSGKSMFAERVALELSDHPVYIATAEPRDDEFRERVRLHRQRRGSEWTNIEEQLHLSVHDVTSRTVLVDCVTMWATNIFFHCGEDLDRSLAMFRREYDALIASTDTTFIFVTNEIGLGGTSSNAMQRRFTDLLGIANRHVAESADEVHMLISGIDLKIK
ncbi:MAG: bifunctional adenosylcobinamide kinase/adenosylcobinamide-phosphate guanylyltransferase [Muribaculum sp.]|nr:bifunctional adenosylcobinamide kinase/adenosylcobinamide-phosphate guanylyltransferase [Muribaculum sp.]